MNLSKFTLAAIVAAGTVLFGAAAPASAGVTISIGVGGGDYYWDRSCPYYYHHRLPAPLRCRGYLMRYWGPDVYVDGDFIFRDRDDYWAWHDRDDYRHWRMHEFRRSEWRHHDWDHDHDWHDHDGGWHDHDHDWHDHHDWDHDH